MTEMVYSFAGMDHLKNEVIVVCHPRRQRASSTQTAEGHGQRGDGQEPRQERRAAPRAAVGADDWQPGASEGDADGARRAVHRDRRGARADARRDAVEDDVVPGTGADRRRAALEAGHHRAQRVGRGDARDVLM